MPLSTKSHDAATAHRTGRMRARPAASVLLLATGCSGDSMDQYVAKSETLRPGWIAMPEKLVRHLGTEGEATRCLTEATTLTVGAGPSVLITESGFTAIELSCNGERGRWDVDAELLDTVLVQVSKAGDLPLKVGIGEVVRMEAVPTQGSSSPGVGCVWASTDSRVVVVMGDGRAGTARGIAVGVAEAVVVCEGAAGVVPLRVP